MHKFTKKLRKAIAAAAAVLMLGSGNSFTAFVSRTHAAVDHLCYADTNVYDTASETEASYPDSISEEGIQFIKNWEGFIQYAKKDVSQYSIGYGTGVSQNKYPNGITRDEADALLRECLTEYVNSLKSFCRKNNISLNQYQFDALIDFSYNLGPYCWTASTGFITIQSYLKTGLRSEEDIRYMFGLYNKVGGQTNSYQVKRRSAEADLFLIGKYGTPESISLNNITCTCNDNCAGTYIVSTTKSGLPFRTDHSASAATVSGCSELPIGAEVTVTKAGTENGGYIWAHVTYKGYSGYCNMAYLQKKSPAATTTTAKPTTTATTTTTTTAATTPITTTYPLGDVNNDGMTDAVDASSVLSYYAMISTNQEGGYSVVQKTAADVNQDGEVNAVDASNILSYYAYISTAKEEIKPMKEFMKK